MRIVSLKEFVKLPAGTLYKVLGERDLCLKGDWISDTEQDWSVAVFAETDPISTNYYLEMSYGESYPVPTESYARDGCFDDNREFLIYERWDLEYLRSLVDRAIKVTPAQKFKSP